MNVFCNFVDIAVYKTLRKKPHTHIFSPYSPVLDYRRQTDRQEISLRVGRCIWVCSMSTGEKIEFRSTALKIFNVGKIPEVTTVH